MRSLILLLIGAFGGMVATIMVQTLDGDGPTPPPEASGGGNARIVFDQDALIRLLRGDLEDHLEGSTVEIKIEDRGIIVIKIRQAEAGSGAEGDLELDPDLRDGHFVINVLSETGDLPDGLVPDLEKALLARLDALAGRSEYRVTAINTVLNRLEIEIEI